MVWDGIVVVPSMVLNMTKMAEKKHASIEIIFQATKKKKKTSASDNLGQIIGCGK